MDAIVHGIVAIIELTIRLLIVIVATPIILLWPRADKTETYWRAVRRRYGRVLLAAFS